MLSNTLLAFIALFTLWQPTACQNATQQTYQSTGMPPCDALFQAGFGDKVLLPSDDDYELSMAGYYSLNSQIRPWCILQPHDTNDVSLAIIALKNISNLDNAGGVAIRSGGHSSAAGASGIVNGITIDLSMMNNTSYDPSTGLGSIEPGVRWQHAYAALSPYNVTVAGGRDGDVGAGGLLLGGGISYFAARTGFSTDSVVNFEVVLANGTVVNANQSHCADLWKALKGGTNNFGIVTRFDVTAIPGQVVAYNQRTISFNHSDAFADAVVNFTTANNNATDDAIVAFYSHLPGVPGTSIILIEINTRGHANSTAYNQFNSIPANITLDKIWTLSEAAIQSQYAGGPRSAGSTLTFKNDIRILHHAISLHESFIKTMTARVGAKNFTTTCFFEPIPSIIERHSREKGGNMLGLPPNQDLILWDAGFEVTTNDADLAFGHAALRSWSAQLKEYAQSIGADVELEYANYADASQDVMGSYSEENVRFMREVAGRYDPEGFFQTRVSGGFKLW